MKSTDLMLGDIVVMNHEGVNKVVRVLRLHQHYADLVNDNGSEFDSVPYTLIEGLPITEAFLSMNGIRTDGYSFNFKEDRRSDLELEFKDDDRLAWTINCGEYSVLLFKCIHELQHAIRLACIEGVADSLKVVANVVQN